MGVVFGLHWPDSLSQLQDRLHQINSHLCYHGPHDFLWCSPPFALGARWDGPGIVHAVDGPLVLVGLLDWYNRDRFDKNPRVNSAELLLDLYRQWGPQAFAKIEGDFALVLVDLNQRKMRCFTDSLAIRQLCYSRNPQRFVASNDPRALFVSGESSRVSEESIARLAFPYQWRDQWDGPFDGFRMVAPSHYVAVEQGQLESQRYHSFALGPSTTPVASQERVYESLHNAVERRLGPRTACMLSGGLDSSIVVAQASQLRAVDCLVAVNAEAPGSFDELKFAQGLEGTNVRLHPILSEGRGPFHQVARQIWSSGHPYLTPAHFVYSAMAEKCREFGFDTLLDGCGGEAGVSFDNLGCWSELFWKGRWRSLVQLAWRSRMADAFGIKPALWEIVRPLIPRRVFEMRPFPAILPIRQDYLQRHLGKERIRLYQNSMRELFTPAWHHQINQARSRDSLAGGLHNPTFEASGVRLRYPLLDRDLLTDSLSAPLEAKFWRGLTRGLARGAPHLPEMIRQRRKKLPFCTDFEQRFLRARPALARFLKSPACREWSQVVDFSAIETALQFDGPGRRWPWYSTVCGGVYLLIFLKNHARMGQPLEQLDTWCPELEEI